MVDTTRSRLCDICSSLDFDYIFDHQISGNHRIDLGLLVGIQKKTFCPFCCLVVALVKLRWDIAAAFGANETTYRCFLGTEPGDKCNSSSFSFVFDEPDRAVFYISVKSASEPEGLGGPYIIPLSGHGPRNRPVFTGSAIGFDHIDFVRIRQWLANCEANHGTRCGRVDRAAIFSNEAHLRVIDVNSRQILKAPRGCRYIALSYVWGSNQQASSGTEVQGFDERNSDAPLPEELPQTIEDAICLTQLLGESYLWVDSLCINQNDPADKGRQIPLMGKIYHCATLTIVAACGDDANAGLAGVRIHNRQDTNILLPVDGRIMTITTDILEHQLLDSKWARRAWTYQEGHMATRCLVLTDIECHYICLEGTCRESLCGTECNSENDRRPGSVVQTNNLLCNIIYHQPLQPEFNFRFYAKTVEKYSERQMTFELDALNACEGILRQFSCVYPTSFLWGLPTVAFGLALLWWPSESLQRRAGFPSWTWAGWSGHISYDRNFAHGLAPHDTDHESSFRRQAQQLLLSSTTQTSYFIKKSNDHIQQIGLGTTTESALSDTTYETQGPGILIFETYSAVFDLDIGEAHERARQGPGHLIVDILDRNGSRQINDIGFGRSLARIDLISARELKDCKGEFVLISEIPEEFSTQHEKWLCYGALLITWSKGVARRSGIGKILIDTWNQANPVKKKVILM